MLAFFLDTSIKDALFHEFKKVGEIVNIKILGTEKDRYALLKFRRLVFQILSLLEL